MPLSGALCGLIIVALRKESVDRNIIVLAVLLMFSLSLSARRAWIEISYIDDKFGGLMVALRKESVDRNSSGLFGVDTVSCRSPQGERG